MHENTATRIREDRRDETQTEPNVLDRLVQDIREDAKLDPEAYIRESIVPEGGE